MHCPGPMSESVVRSESLRPTHRLPCSRCSGPSPQRCREIRRPETASTLAAQRSVLILSAEPELQFGMRRVTQKSRLPECSRSATRDPRDFNRLPLYEVTGSCQFAQNSQNSGALLFPPVRLIDQSRLILNHLSFLFRSAPRLHSVRRNSLWMEFQFRRQVA